MNILREQLPYKCYNYLIQTIVAFKMLKLLVLFLLFLQLVHSGGNSRSESEIVGNGFSRLSARNMPDTESKNTQNYKDVKNKRDWKKQRRIATRIITHIITPDS
jgi:hypothetical protein